MSLKLLWPTPVWEIETPELSDIVPQLLDDIKTKNPQNNTLLSGLLTPAARSFEDLLSRLVENALVEGNYDWRFSKILWIRIRRIRPNEWDPPHIHLGPNLVGAFYLDIQKGHGNLVVVPSGGHSGLSTHKETNSHGTQFGARLYHNIEAKNGKLVLIPSDLIHFVLPNASDQVRYSLALNVELKMK